ncbi:MAG: hypothetical protein ACYTHJ_10045 [Planctomycetota bacterium]
MNECTANVCDAGTCTYPNSGRGAACGDPNTSEYSDRDSDGTFASYETNYLIAGTHRGNAPIIYSGQDTRDGAWSCGLICFPDATPCTGDSNDCAEWRREEVRVLGSCRGGCRFLLSNPRSIAQ